MADLELGTELAFKDARDNQEKTGTVIAVYGDEPAIIAVRPDCEDWPTWITSADIIKK